MSPTRRDTLKAAGAASGLAMLGGHAVAQQDTPEGDDDGPGAQTLESGQGGVRVGHFVSGAPAVNVRLVPSDGTDTSGSDDGEIGGSGTDDTGENETDTGTGGVGDDNETGGNASDDNTSEDLQLGDDNESDDNGTGGMGGNDTDDDETGGVGGNETDDGVGTTGDTSDGEGQLIAENVSFGDVSEYANVEAGDYTVQLLAAEGGTGDTAGSTTGNTSEDLQVGNDSNESDAGNETGGLGGNETGNETGAGDGNESEDDDMFSGGILDDTGNGSDDNETGGMAGNESDDNETGGMAGNETGGVGGNETDDDVGTSDDSGGEVIYEEDVTVGETFYTVAAVGAGADDVDLHVLRDYDAAQVRLVHASPDAAGVDVVAPDANMTLFDEVSFATATEYVGVPPGSYSLSVREATDMNDGDEVDSFDVEVESGEAYSAYAVGSPEGGEEEFDLVFQQDGQGADAGLGQDDAPGQQGEPGGPGASGNETGGPGDDAGPGQDNETGGPGQSDDAGGPGADNATGTDEPGGPGGAAGPNDPGNASGGNASGNESGNESDDEDDGGLLAF